MNNIKWVFLDLGSTLVNEWGPYKARFREAADAAGVTPEEVEAKAVEFSREDNRGDRAACAFYGVELPKWKRELEKLYDGAPELLESLKSKGYKIGVIANQFPGTVDRLTNWGIIDYFDVVFASAEEGVRKPDPEIFNRALRYAGCLPEEALMVGDRIDCDVLPANKLGWNTVRILQGLGKYGVVRAPEEEADYTVSSLFELAELLCK